MSELVEIHPGSAEWKAWLEHHRGTKTEARMLACIGNAKHGRPTRPWLARSKFPPASPRADRITGVRKEDQKPLPERHGIGDGEVAAVADRLLARAARNAAATKEAKARGKKQAAAEREIEEALKRASQNQRPRLDDSALLGVVAVPDPFEAEELVEVGKGPPMRVVNRRAKARLRVVSLRDDPVGVMAKRGKLGAGELGEVRLAAAREWQKLHERAELSNLRGLDPAYDHVDGGTLTAVDSADRIDAIRRLGELSRILGIRSENLVRRVLGEKRTLREAAAIDGVLGASKTHDEKTLEAYGQRFRDSLDDLAGAFRLNVTVTGRGQARPRDKWDAVDIARDNPRLYEAMRRARR